MRNAKSKGRKSHSKSQNGQAKTLQKKDTFTIIGSLREQLKRKNRSISESENQKWTYLKRKPMFSTGSDLSEANILATIILLHPHNQQKIAKNVH